jgi:hypothetical protein
MKLRQALILAINTSILTVLFVFMCWLYWSEKSGVDAAVVAATERTAKITQELVRLRQRELSALARSLAGGPMLRAALSTGDRDTIDDVLSGMAAKNKVAAEVRRGGQARFGRGAAGLSGEADAGDGLTLRLSQAPDAELLGSWTAVTGAYYSIDGGARNVPDGREHYSSPVAAEGLPSRLTQHIPREPFWKPFEKRRNTLIVLGAALFFLGLLLSVAFAEAVERLSRASSGAEEWARLLDEIEAGRPGQPR